MRIEFRTLCGAFAVREVAEPLPKRIQIPLVLPRYTTATEIARAETRTYELVDAFNLTTHPFYVEVHDEHPSGHATEIERIAEAIERAIDRSDGRRQWSDFREALRDLRSLGKRHFGHTSATTTLQDMLGLAERERDLTRRQLTEARAERDAALASAELLADERAAHNLTKSCLETSSADKDRAIAALRETHDKLTAERGSHAETKRERDKWASLATRSDGADLRTALKEFLA
jgi:hypothetical protein